MSATPKSDVPTRLVCRICTIRLVELCYQRAWWFRGFRGALTAGMRLFALFCRIHPENYVTRSPVCHGCLRFQKNTLKEQSALFRWLDSHINPVFNRLRDSLLTEQELEEARQFAREAAHAGKGSNARHETDLSNPVAGQ